MVGDGRRRSLPPALIWIALTVVAAAWLGVGMEKRFAARAEGWARRAILVSLYTAVPFVAFTNLSRLEIDLDVGAGIGLAYVAVGIVTALAWFAAGARGMSRPRQGAVACSTLIVNSGYLGYPLTLALLGGDDLPRAVAYDTLVAAPCVLVIGFAIGAATGTKAGDRPIERVRAFFFRNPPLLAAVAGLLVPASAVPDLLVDASRGLVIALLPVGFAAVGVALSAESRRGAFEFPAPPSRPVVAVMALRAAAPLVLLAISAPLIDLPAAYLLIAAMPTGINSLIVAHAYGLDLRITAEAIAWTTAVAIPAAFVAATVGA